MKKTIFVAGAVVALSTAAGIALAQDGDRPGRPDPNASETRQQVIARVDALFARLDANHDGRVTPEEMQAMGERRRGEMQQHAGEMREHAGDMRQHMFDRLDANHDGSISREEFAAAHQAGGPHPGMMPPPPGGPEGPEGHRGMGGGGRGGMGMRMFGDQGFITLEQMRARALERFDRADANHDGVLTPAERQAARAQRRERGE